MWRQCGSAALLLGGALCAGQAGIDWLQSQTTQASGPTLRIRRLGLTVPVVEGTEHDDLAKGAGHLPGSANFGVPGNAVVAGHRDTSFAALQGIRRGDVIEVGRYRYRVTRTLVIWPTQTEVLQPTDDPVLTLITCYPFHYVGPAPRRLAIRARLLPADDRSRMNDNRNQ